MEIRFYASAVSNAMAVSLDKLPFIIIHLFAQKVNVYVKINVC